MDRRTLLFGAGALAACAHTTSSQRQEIDDFLHRAMDAIGGEEALRRARVMEWTAGEATYVRGRLSIEWDVRVVVEPFVYARLENWLWFDDTPASIVEINEGRGWLISDNGRSLLTPGETAHYRDEFAVFGLMRLVPLSDGNSGYSVSHLSEGADETRLFIEHPRAAPTTLTFDAQARIRRAEYDDDRRIEFSGNIEGGGVRWPSEMLFYRRNRIDRAASIRDPLITRQQR